MNRNQSSALQGQKMRGYPEKIFDENAVPQSNSPQKLQMTLSSLLTLGISIKRAKSIYTQLQHIVCQSPQLNRYDILIQLAEKIATL